MQNYLHKGLTTITQSPNPFATMIVSTNAGTTVTAPFTVDFVSTLSTSDFAVGDITVTNGSASSFAGSGTIYSCLVTPTSSGAVTVKVSGAKYTSNGYPNLTSNTLSVTYTTGGVNARIFIIGGQSNVIPGGNLVSDFPPELRATLSAKLWDNVNNIWNNIHAGFNGVGGYPIVKMAYDLTVRYPSDEIYFVQNGLSGYSMYYHWLAGGDSYNQTLGFFNSAIATLSDRNFLEKTWFLLQGESDAVSTTFSNAYQGLLTNFVTGVRSDFGVTKVLDGNIYVNLPIGSYPQKAAIRTAKANVDSGDANVFLANSDSYGFQGDNTHLNISGVQSMGAWAAAQ